MKYKLLLILLISVILITLVQAVDFSPQGNINMKGINNLTGAPYINATLYYGNLSQMTGAVSSSNSSDYWDDYDTASDLNNLITIQGENISGGTIDFSRLPTLTNMLTLDWANITNRFITAVDNLYIYMSGTTLTLNETKLNETIKSIDTATNTSMKNYVDNIDGYSLSHWSDDLGNRGYTHFSNFTDDFGYYNSTDFSISDYYLESNPYSFYNSTNPQPISDVWVNESGDTMTGNLTGTWFNGKFNWTTTDEWSSFDGSTFDFNESNLATTYFDANATQVVTGSGSGSLSDIQSKDGLTYNVTETNSDYELIVNFTGITEFTTLLIRHKTDVDAGHIAAIQIWDYNNSRWDGIGYLTESTTSEMKTLGIYNGDDHISGGIVQIRFYQDEGPPNIAHIHQFDWVELSKGYGTPAGAEVDPHSVHTDGTSPLSANWGQGAFNLTDTTSWFLGKVAWATIQDKFITAVDDAYIYMVGTTATLNETKLNNTIETIDTVTNTSMRGYVDAQDSAQDECSEITGCVENAYNNITNFTGTLTDAKICIYDASQQIINCTYTDQTGAGGNVKTGDGTYTYNDTDAIYFNATYAGINLEVNGSDYWDNLGSPSDINAGDITDDGTYTTPADVFSYNYWNSTFALFNKTYADTLYRLQSWNNLTGIPHATPSNGDVTHFSLADEIYDWVISLNYVANAITDVVSDTTPQLGGSLDAQNNNVTNQSYSTFCNGANCWKMYVNASDYFIIEEI